MPGGASREMLRLLILKASNMEGSLMPEPAERDRSYHHAQVYCNAAKNRDNFNKLYDDFKRLIESQQNLASVTAGQQAKWMHEFLDDEGCDRLDPKQTKERIEEAYKTMFQGVEISPIEQGKFFRVTQKDSNGETLEAIKVTFSKQKGVTLTLGSSPSTIPLVSMALNRSFPKATPLLISKTSPAVAIKLQLLAIMSGHQVRLEKHLQAQVENDPELLELQQALTTIAKNPNHPSAEKLLNQVIALCAKRKQENSESLGVKVGGKPLQIQGSTSHSSESSSAGKPKEATKFGGATFKLSS